MTSKTELTKLNRAWRRDEFMDGLNKKPELLDFHDDRGRGWLHICAGVLLAPASSGPDRNSAKASIDLAQALLDAGLDINAPAFIEGSWHATPLWFAVGRGQNRPLAEFLLQSGSSPEHCLWAAAFNENVEMLHLLIEYGAPLEAIAEDETALLHAVKWSKFDAARALLEAGCDPDFQDSKAMTALHYMLKKRSPKPHYELFIEHQARGGIANHDGMTAKQIMDNKRDPDYATLAAQLR